MGRDLTSEIPEYVTAFGVPSTTWSVVGLQTTATEAARIPGSVVHSSDMRVVVSGTPTSADSLEFETVAGGFPGSGSSFRWNIADGPWMGWDEPPRLRDFLGHDEMSTALDETPLTQDAVAFEGVGFHVLEIVDENDLHTIVIQREKVTGGYTRSVRDSFEAVSGFQALPRLVSTPKGVELYYQRPLDNGRIGLRRQLTTDSGGGTWTVTSDNLLPFELDNAVDGIMCAAGGGSHMLYMWTVEDGVDTVFHLASSDGGNNFSLVNVDEGADADDGGGSTTAAGKMLYTPAGFLLVRPYEFRLYPSAYGIEYREVFAPTVRYRELAAFTDEAGVHWVAGQRSGVTTVGLEWVRSSDAVTWAEYKRDGETDTSGFIGDIVSMAAVWSGTGGKLYWAVDSDDWSVWACTMGGYTAYPLGRMALYHAGWELCWSAADGVLPQSHSQPPGGLVSFDGGLSGSSSITWTGAMRCQIASGEYATWNWVPEAGVFQGVSEAEFALDGSGQVYLTARIGAAEEACVRLDLTAHTVTYGTTQGDGNDISDFTADTPVTVSSTGRVALRVVVYRRRASAYYRVDDDDWTALVEDVEVPQNIASPAPTTESRLRVWQVSDVKVYSWRTLQVATSVEDTATTPFNGREWSTEPLYVADGQSVSASGLTVTGDRYIHTPDATYRAENVLTPSPRVGWRSTDSANQYITFQNDGFRGSLGTFIHLEAMRAEKLIVSTSTDGVTYALVDTLPLLRTFEAVSDHYEAVGSTVYLGLAAEVDGVKRPHVRANELAGGVFIDENGEKRNIVSNTSGAWGSGPGRAALHLDFAVTSPGGEYAVWLPRSTALVWHAEDDDVRYIRIEFEGAHGTFQAGTVWLSDAVFIPTQPDETRSQVFELNAEVYETTDGRETPYREQPDRRRVETAWTRTNPNVGAIPGTFSYWRPSGDPAGRSIIAHTTPDVLSGIVEVAGRDPLLYVPRFRRPGTDTGLHVLDEWDQDGVMLARIVPSTFRRESAQGAPGSADELQRTSVLTLREIV